MRRQRRKNLESPFTKSVVDLLLLTGQDAYRVNSGKIFIPAQGPTRRARMISMAPTGTPDIHATIPPLGRCLDIETKVAGGKLSEAQKARHMELRRAGAIVGVITSEAEDWIQDVKALIREAGGKIK